MLKKLTLSGLVLFSGTILAVENVDSISELIKTHAINFRNGLIWGAAEGYCNRMIEDSTGRLNVPLRLVTFTASIKCSKNSESLFNETLSECVGRIIAQSIVEGIKSDGELRELKFRFRDPGQHLKLAAGRLIYNLTQQTINSHINNKIV